MAVPVVLVIVALVFFVIARSMAVEARLLAAEGVDTVAVVEDRTRRFWRDTEGRDRFTHYLTFAFTLPDGQRHQDRRQVSQALHDRVAVGDRIEIRYARSRPDINRLEGQDTTVTRVAMNLGSSLLLMVAGLMAWLNTGRLRAMLRAARRGPAGQARVMGQTVLQRRYGRLLKAPLTRLDWRDDAHNRSGRTPPVDQTLAAAFPPGARLTVWHDPESDHGFWEEELVPGSALRNRPDGAAG